MAIDDTQARTPRAEDPPTPQGPVRVRTMRAESQFRTETRNLHREERDRFSNFLWNVVSLDLGPRVALVDVVGQHENAPLDTGKERALRSSLDYYERKEDHTEFIRVLKFYVPYIMHQARREEDWPRQLFLLFKAVDLCRTIVQYSPWAVAPQAEAIVYGVFADLGTQRPEQFGPYARSEERVYALMRRIAALPNELGLRLALGDELSRQTAPFDALVQYRMLLRLASRRSGAGSEALRARVIMRIGDVFQEVAEHGTGQLRDARKLRSFVERYNREGGHDDLPQVRPDDHASLMRVRRALLVEGTRWHMHVLGMINVPARIRANLATKLGRSYNHRDQHAETTHLMYENYRLWDGVKETPEVLKEKMDYLQVANTAALQTRERTVLEWVQREQRVVGQKVQEIENQQRERRRLRAAMQASHGG